MTVAQLIAALAAMPPGAAVLFDADAGSGPVAIEGGVRGLRDGRPIVLLAPIPLPDVGGF